MRIDDKAENQFVLQLLHAAYSGQKDREAWIGLAHEEHSTNWRWTTGNDLFPFNKFAAQPAAVKQVEPSENRRVACMSAGGFWKHYPAYSSLPAFVCEWDTEPGVSLGRYSPKANHIVANS